MLAKTMLLFTTLTALLMVFGFVIGLFLGSPLDFMSIGLVFAAVINFASYMWSDKFVLWSTHTKLIQEIDNPQLYSVVRNVAQRADIPMPRVGIVNSPQPNAFATGRGPDKAVVVATSGILRALTPGELEAVIGHEISHVTHRDMLVASVAATIAGTISYLGQMILWSSFFGGSRNRNNNGAYLMIIAAILIPIGAMLVQLGISRSRESAADEEGARLTQRPQELINALRKISTSSRASQWGQQTAPSPATSSLWIVNPLKGNSWTEMFSTHPSLQHRIERISKVATELGIVVS
ncbi:MAG: M48 family metalloprotease [Nitrososphaerota archaeon]|nr:M48 family metalloprotease [Nitrososphaerota archaeon]MDG6922890.1 M48 family metalloprotease [Nitrososphaerota archaeon]